MAQPRKSLDGGIETDTGIVGSTYKKPPEGKTSQGGTITSDGVYGAGVTPPVSTATPATPPASFPLKTAGTVTATGVTGAGYKEPPAGYTSDGGKITSTGVTGKGSGTPLAGSAVAAFLLNPLSKDWRISKDKEGGYHHVAPNTQAEEGHTLVGGSNTTNASDAMWKFRGMRSAARNQAVADPAAEVAADPVSTEPRKEWQPMGFAGVANSRPAPVVPDGEKAKPNWWANLKGTSLDAPARLKGDGNSFVGGNYNPLNRAVGDQQTSFTDMQKRAMPDSGAIKGSEEGLHEADLLARGETEQMDVINAQGQVVPQVFSRAPQFEEDPTMSAAKERRLMARSRKWGQTETLQKQWRGRVFNKR
jgi:hypothetical protein